MRTILANWLLLFTPLLFASSYPPVDVPITLKQVSEHVWYAQGKAGAATEHQGFISNASAIVTAQGVVVVDALGTPSLARKFLDELAKITRQPVKKVIITHYHADHIYGLQVFKQQGAQVLAPAGFDEYLDAPIAQQRLEERRTSLAPWVNEHTRLVRPDVIIDQDSTIELGGVRIQLKYLGKAHSDGDLSVLVQPDQVLISGDLIFEGRIPFTGSSDTRRWLNLLENLQAQGVKALIPGHGPAAQKPAEAVRLTLNYLRKTREAMRQAVDELMPFDEAYAEADWSEFENLPAFNATHRRNAYGIYLSLEQEMMGE